MNTRDPDPLRDPELKGDLEATLQTRKELGEGYESELVDAFLEKVERRIDTAVDRRVRRRLAEEQMAPGRTARGRPRGNGSNGPGPAFGLAALSLMMAIPLSAIAAANAGLPGLLICWGGIVGVNACYAVVTGALRPGRNAGTDAD
ncbi:hypothetical protein GCM10009716_25630 [Streptomyces sodiiphilus]|uniref:Integral membrane protein n=1 Tax=Streptomyces sodiiphilus TaxID=226217 RepID=A0ABN2P8S0_9ACTN